jgi:hypothetical protein
MSAGVRIAAEEQQTGTKMRRNNPKICPITGEPIKNRKSDAIYSAKGKKIYKKAYYDLHSYMTYRAKKLIGVGVILVARNDDAKTVE